MKVLSVSLIPGPSPERRREITESLAATFMMPIATLRTMNLTFMMRIATPRMMKNFPVGAGLPAIAAPAAKQTPIRGQGRSYRKPGIFLLFHANRTGSETSLKILYLLAHLLDQQFEFHRRL